MLEDACRPFELLADEPKAAVRVVLEHFIFAYVHPYFDGNGRIGRFLMNMMRSFGAYPLTVIPVERRDDYRVALEAASVDGNIQPFAEFSGESVKHNMKGKLAPKVPGQ